MDDQYLPAVISYNAAAWNTAPTQHGPETFDGNDDLWVMPLDPMMQQGYPPAEGNFSSSTLQNVACPDLTSFNAAQVTFSPTMLMDLSQQSSAFHTEVDQDTLDTTFFHNQSAPSTSFQPNLFQSNSFQSNPFQSNSLLLDSFQPNSLQSNSLLPKIPGPGPAPRKRRQKAAPMTDEREVVDLIRYERVVKKTKIDDIKDIVNRKFNLKARIKSRRWVWDTTANRRSAERSHGTFVTGLSLEK
ncbi:hypothetical protein ACEPPN_017710 [Leptodophora sp. 'Broadleaf-Isolate-01']